MSLGPLPLCTRQVLDYRLIYAVDLSGRGVNSRHCYFHMDSGRAVVAVGGIRVCRMDDVLCCGLLPSLCLLIYDKNIKISHSLNVQISFVMDLHTIIFTPV
jgi:hypothetical protein